MGRGSQVFWYVNREEHPTEREKAHVFSHINIGDALKKLRGEYRRELRKPLSGRGWGSERLSDSG